MRHSQIVWIIPIAGFGLIAGSARSWDDPPSSTNGRTTAMGEMARAITLNGADPGMKAELVGEPIYRFDDPTRQYSDGTLWAFGRSGRPTALLCLSLEKNTRGEFWWLHELTSLSSGPASARSHHAYGAWTWDTKEAGVKFQAVPKAAAPGDEEPGRLRQMKEIARRFKAFESLKPDRDDPSDRFELRLLTQPVHRYHDADKGLIDGAIFLMSYGRNPEIALMIEAGREKAAKPSWSYALAPIAASRLRVSLDDREVADIPKPVDANWQKPYCILVRQAFDMKD